MPEPILVDTVEIEDPPNELLCHRYCKKKLQWSMKSLKTTIPGLSGKIDNLQQFITDQIICIHANDEDSDIFLNRLFRASVKLRKLEHGIPADGLQGRLVMVTVQTSERQSNEISLTGKSMRLLEALRQNEVAMVHLQNILFLVDVHIREDREKVETKMKLILGSDLTLSVFDIGADKRYIRDALHKRFRESITVLLSSLETRLPIENISLDDADENEISRDPNLVKFIETTINLRRMLRIPSRANVVSPRLRQFFQGMHRKGYCGHGYVDGRFTIYVKQSTTPDDIADIKEEAQKDFDYVTVSVKRHVGVCPFVQPDIRVVNSVEKMGTLGVFAKLQPDDKVAALSVAHFSNAGQNVTFGGQTIGKCIWPSRDPNNSNINDVSVIKIKKKHRKQCQYEHENLELEKRPLILQNDFPSIFSEVFKGCGLTGLMTGTVISTQFELEFRGEFLKVILVEGDDNVDFAVEGDSGAIIKLKKELDKKLVGVAMIFGGANRIENVRDGTCMGISVLPSVRRFEQQTNNRLIFEKVS